MLSQNNPSTSASSTEDVFCPKCTYNLRGTAGDHCPECGYCVEAMRRGEVRIPWERRREIGRLRAYCQTAWMMTFHPRSIAECMAADVCYRDAQRFRWLTIAFAYAPVLLLTFTAYAVGLPGTAAASGYVQPGTVASPEEWAYAQVWPAAILHLCVLLFLAGASGIPGYFFHPKSASVRRQNNGVAMSYYTCGPLALLAIPLLTGAGCVFYGGTISDAGYGLAWAFIVTSIAVPLTWWLTVVHTFRAVMPRHTRRFAALALGILILWPALAAVVFVALPALIVYVLVIIDSLRA